MVYIERGFVNVDRSTATAALGGRLPLCPHPSTKSIPPHPSPRPTPPTRLRPRSTAHAFTTPLDAEYHDHMIICQFGATV